MTEKRYYARPLSEEIAEFVSRKQFDESFKGIIYDNGGMIGFYTGDHWPNEDSVLSHHYLVELTSDPFAGQRISTSRAPGDNKI